MRLRGYGKLNLAFSVTGVMENGYHSVKTMYQSISLFDEITLKKNNGKIHLTCSEKELPTDEKNIGFRAAMRFFQESKIFAGVNIHIEKGIPFEAGLAGGSADAAAVLVGLNELFGHPLTMETLLKIGSALGADVPFSILGGTRLGTGIGDVLSENLGLDTGCFIVAKPCFGNPTAEMFHRLDKEFSAMTWDDQCMIQHIKNRDLKAIGEGLCNCFTPYSNHPDIIAHIMETLRDLGAVGASMTGSGSTVFGIFEQAPDMNIAAAQLPGLQMVCMCRPVLKGTEIIAD